MDNFPFLHIYKIEGRDASVFGSLKKAIRLCKHVKADASEEGRNISLSSFDIASAMYYADQAALRSGLTHELAILAETQRHLDYLTCNEGYAKTLIVPDGSRTIFNDNDKLTGLRRLSIEIDDLTREVAKEQNSILRLYDQPSLQESRSALSTAYIPGF